MLQLDKLTQPQIFTLCTLPPVQNWILQMDIAFYQVIIDVLVPSVLMSQMTRKFLLFRNTAFLRSDTLNFHSFITRKCHCEIGK